MKNKEEVLQLSGNPVSMSGPQDPEHLFQDHPAIAGLLALTIDGRSRAIILDALERERRAPKPTDYTALQALTSLGNQKIYGSEIRESFSDDSYPSVRLLAFFVTQARRQGPPFVPGDTPNLVPLDQEWVVAVCHSRQTATISVNVMKLDGRAPWASQARFFKAVKPPEPEERRSAA